MRRFALLSLLALLPSCGYFENPLVGSGEFIGETHTWRRNPNRPIGNSENMLRVTGRQVTVAPVQAEPGNVWPGPQAPDPTLEDIERQQNLNQPQSGQTPGEPGGQPNSPPPRVTRGSSSPSSPDGMVAPPPRFPGPTANPSSSLPTQTPTPRSFNTPTGPAVTNPGGNGVTTYQAPGGGTGIVVPNGNGTSTLVAPDGSVTTVTNPK